MARKRIRDEFKDDLSFRAGYVCDITTLLYTNFPDVKISFEKKKNYINDMADELLDLIFR